VRRGAMAVVMLLALLALAGCGSSKKAESATSTSVPEATGNGAADADVTDRFWKTISAMDTLATVTPGRDKAAALAQQVCAAINPAMTIPEAQAAATSVLNTAGVRAAVVPYWAGASTAAFCPQYSKLLAGS
jgi:hypothetical protein